MDELLLKFEQLIEAIDEDTIVEDLHENKELIAEICQIHESLCQCNSHRVLYDEAKKRIIREFKANYRDTNNQVKFSWMVMITRMANIDVNFLPSVIRVYVPVLNQLINS